MMVTSAEKDVNQRITSCCLPHQFTWLAMLVWQPPLCQCVHACHFQTGMICVWNINRHPSCKWPFCVVFISRRSRTSNEAPFPCLMFNSETRDKKQKKNIRKWGIYIRVSKHLRVTLCSCWYWDVAVWHLALPLDSNGDSLCCPCP